MYSVFKSVPIILQPFVYRGGTYHYPGIFDVDSLELVNSEFNDSYMILDNLIGLTEIEDSARNTFMMMDNDTTHDPTELQLPDYKPVGHIDNSGIETGYRSDAEGNTIQISKEYYHVNMAALLKLSEWLDFLRDNNVYDNTRIIIVSDHGSSQGEFKDKILKDGTDTEGFSPLLLCKDFGDKGFKVSHEFMTNADTPLLAVSGISDKTVNPFTGNILDGHEKLEQEQLVLASYFIENLTATVFEEPGQKWYSVRNDPTNLENWKTLGD